MSTKNSNLTEACGQIGRAGLRRVDCNIMLRTILGIALVCAPRKNARVHIVYVETRAAALAEQNRSRERGVPPEVISRSLAL
jgi:hypothetical protein